jgi:hypothetical protein
MSSSVLTRKNLDNIKKLYEEYEKYVKQGNRPGFVSKYSEPDPYHDNAMSFYDPTAEYIFRFPVNAKQYIDSFPPKEGGKSRRRKSRRRKSRRYSKLEFKKRVNDSTVGFASKSMIMSSLIILMVGYCSTLYFVAMASLMSQSIS